MRPKLHTMSSLAVELNLDRRTVAGRLRTVEPDGQIGRNAGWRLLTALPHLLPGSGKAATTEDEKKRLTAAQADLAELRLARERGELVDAHAVAQTWARTFTTIRDLLRAFPRASAERLLAAAGDGRAAFAAALLAEVDDVLLRASTTKVEVKLDDVADDDA